MSNAINQPGQQAVVSNEKEMAALDSFGPMLRHAIVNAPLSVLAYPIQQQIADYNATHDTPIDPLNPEIDKSLARGIVAHNYRLLLKDRDEIDARAGVIPLKPRKRTK